MIQKAIKKEYEKILKIPHRKLKQQMAICPIGVVGSGKTTVIKPLSKKLSLLRISTDEIRKLLKDRGYGYDSAKDVAYAIADAYLTKGFSIAMDGNCSSKDAQKYIKKLRKKHKVKVFWIHINPPESFIIKKLKNYKHTWLFKDAREAIKNYRSSKARHRNLNFPFVYIFDPSRDDLDKQIKEAASRIKKEIH